MVSPYAANGKLQRIKRLWNWISLERKERKTSSKIWKARLFEAMEARGLETDAWRERTSGIIAKK